MKAICGNCQKEYRTHPAFLGRRGKLGVRFCSRKCWSEFCREARKKRRTISCSVCGREWVLSTNPKEGFPHVCSPHCRGKMIWRNYYDTMKEARVRAGEKLSAYKKQWWKEYPEQRKIHSERMKIWWEEHPEQRIIHSERIKTRWKERPRRESEEIE